MEPEELRQALSKVVAFHRFTGSTVSRFVSDEKGIDIYVVSGSDRAAFGELANFDTVGHLKSPQVPSAT